MPTGDEPVTLGALAVQVREGLLLAGIEAAAREARQLICALTGISPEAFIGHPDLCVDAVDRDRVLLGMKKRAAGMPIGRIVGEREFYGRAFALGSSILEPRSDSEVLIDAAIEIVHGEEWEAKPLRIVDVGTGSGCLLITLLAELPNASGVGIDISTDALVIAAQNAERHGVEDRIQFRQGDALDDVTDVFDLLISNPPYIRTGDIENLDIEVRAHDPGVALDGGPDGLTVYRRIAANVNIVVPDGWVLFEVGAGMAKAVCHEVDQLAGQGHVQEWRMWQDLNGHARCVATRTLNV